MSTNSFESPKVECSPELPSAPRRNWKDYSPEYDGAFWTGLKTQAGWALLTSLVLDCGQTPRAFWVAVLCYWIMVWIIVFQRPMNPTRLDLWIVRYGVVPLLFIVAGFGPALLDVLKIKRIRP